MIGLKITKGDKTKTFNSEQDIDHFTGAADERFNHRRIESSIYIDMCILRGYEEHWDDGTEMSAEDWLYVVYKIFQLRK